MLDSVKLKLQFWKVYMNFSWAIKLWTQKRKVPTNLCFLTNMVKRSLVQGLGSHQIVSPQNCVPATESLGLGNGLHAHSQASVLAETRGFGDAEEAAVEVDGGGERRSVINERGNWKRWDGATIAIGHYASDGVVIGNAGVAELHGLGGELDEGGFIGFLVGNVEIEESHYL